MATTGKIIFVLKLDMEVQSVSLSVQNNAQVPQYAKSICLSELFIKEKQLFWQIFKGPLRQIISVSQK